MGRALVLLAAVCLAAGSLPAADKEKGKDVPVGDGSFEFAPNPKAPDRKLTVWTHWPKEATAKSPIVFVMHGVKRNGKTYRDNWAEHSDKGKFLLLVPEFPEKEYPSEQYQQGNVVDGKGNAVPPAD